MTVDSNRYYDKLTPDNAAVLFIDHQTGLMTNVQTVDPVVLKNNVMALAQTAQIYNLPTILTASAPSGPNGPLLGGLSEAFPNNEIIERTKINAWDDENFVTAVEKTSRKKLIMAGIVTDVCLAFPAIAATRAGYDVYAVVDASGTWSPLIEQAALFRMSQAGVIPTTWVAITAELQGDWALETGQSLGQLYANRLAPYSFLIDSFYAHPGQAEG
jgi:nicotinamidase-related amidase